MAVSDSLAGNELSQEANGISTGARAVVELRDPHKALMAELSSAKQIQHLNQVITRE